MWHVAQSNLAYLVLSSLMRIALIISWNSVAIRWNVEDLCIILDGYVPSRLFNCKTLRRLYLVFPYLRSSISKVSKHWLLEARFDDDESMNKLSADWQTFEELNLLQCNLLNLQKVEISPPKLLSLVSKKFLTPVICSINIH